MEPLVQFTNYSFKYRSQAEPTLKNINLSIYPGEHVLIAGPSGSGKSTLSRCLNALVPSIFEGSSEGSLSVCGLNPQKEGVFGMSHKIGTVLQDTDGQFIGLTVAEDIAFALENEALPRAQMLSKVQEAAQLVDMASFLAKPPRLLSGGQKQRVSLAGVLVSDADILLFDEPLANLDPASGHNAMELIRSLKKTVLIIEHRVEEVLECGVDRVVVISGGSITFNGKPEELLASNVLASSGIREPLYISAIKQAGKSIDSASEPCSVESIHIASIDSALTEGSKVAFQAEVPPKENNILTFEDISFSYPAFSESDKAKKALSNITFSIKEGEMLSIVGKNGAGKTTLSSLALGFILPTSGRILFKGEDMAPLSIKERGERIGLVMQNPNQMISKPFIFDEVALGLRLRKVPKEEVEERVYKALKICGLYSYRNWPISALSFGQKKRVTIASILVLNPSVLILDEPTAGQDYRHYTQIMEFLVRLNKEHKYTILMITHDMHLMLEYTDRSVVLADGQLVADDKSYKILSSEEITAKAALRKTSLYTLALRLGVKDTDSFIERFIRAERTQREATFHDNLQG